MKTHNAICSAIVWLGTCATLLAAEPVSVVQKSVANPQQPQAAVDERGTIYIAFGAGEAVYCCTSTDGGATYGNAVKVGDVRKLALGMRRGPRIAASGDAVVVTAISHDSGNVMAWRSTDGGKTWQGPVQVNDSPNSAREGLHAMAMGPGGKLFCTWLDLRNKGTQIFGAGSTDGGKTWNANLMIYRSPGGSVCQCCHPAATYDSDGGLFVMWRNELNGFRDLWGSYSKDGGKTFGRATKIGTGSWKLDGCPMDGGYLATTAPGKLTTVWLRDNQVFRTDSGTRQEKLVGKGEQPWVAATSDGAYVVWISRDNGDLWLATPDSRQPRKLSADAMDPVVAASLSRKGPVVAVWQTGRRRDTSIMAAVVGK